MNVTILQAMNDPELFGAMFKPRMFRRDSWKSWRSFLAALFALPMDAEMLATYQKHTARTDAPSAPFSECWCVCGRRSGKSAVAAATAVFLSAFRDYSAYRAPGETLILPVVAPDRRQCRTILGYVNGLLDASPVLSSLVRNRLKESVEVNGVRIEVATASFRTIRGYSAVAGIIDEAAFLRSDESATPDSELIAALVPSMSTIPGALLLAISSPYARRGELWRNYKEHFGKNDSPVLVWQAETRAMNPTVSRSIVDAAIRRDPAAAGAEYLARFRDDVESFLPLEVIESCVVPGRRELPPLFGANFFGFVDASGGRVDSMCLGIAHAERDRAVLDLLREVQPPFSPSAIVAEFADTLKRYRVFSVTGDRYGAEWVKEQFENCGVQYRSAEKTRSEYYLEVLPALTSGQVELLDNPRLVAQFASLERRTSRAGKDAIDHPPGGHDDLCNAAAGAVVEALRSVFGDVLGYLEWEKANAAGIVRAKTQLQPAVAEEQQNPPCPQCKAVCVTRLATGVFRCSQCGEQFRKDGAAEAEVVVPSRTNLHQFEGTKTTTDPRSSQSRARSFWQFLDMRK